MCLGIGDGGQQKRAHEHVCTHSHCRIRGERELDSGAHILAPIYWHVSLTGCEKGNTSKTIHCLLCSARGIEGGLALTVEGPAEWLWCLALVFSLSGHNTLEMRPMYSQTPHTHYVRLGRPKIHKLIFLGFYCVRLIMQK